jgi:Concanavalin A-like lectin/glucanases superfamily
MTRLRAAIIHGYSDRLSVAPGERIELKVSSEEPGTYRADIVRLIHGDTNPAGPGFKEQVIETAASGDHAARFQPTDGGSCVVVDGGAALALSGAFTLHAFVMPTTPGKPDQGIMGRYATGARRGYALALDAGGLALRVDDAVVSTGAPLHPWCWYSVAAVHDGAGSVTLYVKSVVSSVNSLVSPIVPISGEAVVERAVPGAAGDAGTVFTIAGLAREAGSAWVGPEERIGDFGLTGGGAAGYELDRYDLTLGTPPGDSAFGLQRRPLGQLPARRRGDLLQLPAPGRDDGLPGPCGHHVLFDQKRRRGLLDELDRVVRRARAQRLRQQRLAHDGERAAPLPERRAAPGDRVATGSGRRAAPRPRRAGAGAGWRR